LVAALWSVLFALPASGLGGNLRWQRLGPRRPALQGSHPVAGSDHVASLGWRRLLSLGQSLKVWLWVLDWHDFLRAPTILAWDWMADGHTLATGGLPDWFPILSLYVVQFPTSCRFVEPDRITDGRAAHSGDVPPQRCRQFGLVANAEDYLWSSAAGKAEMNLGSAGSTACATNRALRAQRRLQRIEMKGGSTG
jgi:hypothetical protein